MSYLRKRGSKYHFRRRVPSAYKDFFPKDVIQVPLNTDSEAIARQRAINFNLTLEDFWRDVVSAESDQVERLYRQAIVTAKMSGFQYRTAQDIANYATSVELLNRINAATAAQDDVISEAIIGHVDRPEITLSKVYDIFLEHERGNLTALSSHQMRKWENPRKRALKNLTEILGDKPVESITREDILKFRDWWVGRIKTQNKATNSANKEFTFVKKALSTTIDNFSLTVPIDQLFRKVRLKDVEKNRRYPFSADFIQNTLLNPEIIRMNEECRMFIYAMADTGARLGELVGLEEEDVILNAPIPHIKIRPNGMRGLKTLQSERDIPLVGASLYAFQTLKGPFKRYHGKPDVISSTINKYCRENKLFDPKHYSLYSLRHSFEDRLTAVEPPDKVQAELMGHKYVRPRYGHGASLEQKQLWLKKIAFRVHDTRS